MKHHQKRNNKNPSTPASATPGAAQVSNQRRQYLLSHVTRQFIKSVRVLYLARCSLSHISNRSRGALFQ
ncbi:MAG: hypothetical protein Q7T62_10925 [Undibacterium sp.]|nr:hypothetical protein [Undibacterium sp.]